MKITVELEEDILENVMKFTGESKKGPAIAKATEEFVKRALNKEFGRLVMEEGLFSDYPLTNEELEASDR